MGDHRESKAEWPAHIAARCAEGRKAWKAVETPYQDGQSVRQIAVASGVDMSTWPEMSDVDCLVSIAKHHCLVRNNWSRLTDKTDPRVVPPPATRLCEATKPSKSSSQGDVVSSSGRDPEDDVGDSDMPSDRAVSSHRNPSFAATLSLDRPKELVSTSGCGNTAVSAISPVTRR